MGSALFCSSTKEYFQRMIRIMVERGLPRHWGVYSAQRLQKYMELSVDVFGIGHFDSIYFWE